MKHIFKGFPHPVWICNHNDTDLNTAVLSGCKYVLLVYQPWSRSDEQALMLFTINKVNVYHSGECATWLVEHDCRFMKFILIAEARHLYDQATYGIIFHSEYDLLEFKLMWGNL